MPVVMLMLILLSYNWSAVCGPESLLTVCKLFGIPASIEELCRLSGQDETGTSMYGLWYAAKVKGLDCKEIPLSGEILGEIELKPPRLFFGMMRAGERKELKVEILKSGEADLRLMSVEGAGKLVEIKRIKEVEKGRRYELRVVLHPVRRGEIEGKLKVRTNNERQPVFEIPFYGYCLNSK